MNRARFRELEQTSSCANHAVRVGWKLDPLIMKMKDWLVKPHAPEDGDVVKVIDAIKGAGANPVGLQVDDLP